MAPVDPHYVWAAGHIVMLTGAGGSNTLVTSRLPKALTPAAYIIFQTALFRGTPPKTYRISYGGALLSYAIVVYKSLGIPSLDPAWARRAFVDENVQYMVLALYWCVARSCVEPWLTSGSSRSLSTVRRRLHATRSKTRADCSDYHPLCNLLALPHAHFPPNQRHPQVCPVSLASGI